MNTMAYLLPFLALAFLAGGVALAIDRRKAVLWVGIGITASVLLPLEAIYFAQAPFVAMPSTSSAECPNPRRVAVYTIVFRNLVAAQQLFTVVGLVFVVGAILAGPNRFATSLRNGFKHGMASIGPDWDFGPAGEWIYVHQSGMRTAGIIGAIVMLLIAPVKSYATIVWLVVFVVSVDRARRAVRPSASRQGRGRRRGRSGAGGRVGPACLGRVAAPCTGRYTRGCTSRRVGFRTPRRCGELSERLKEHDWKSCMRL